MINETLCLDNFMEQSELPRPALDCLLPVSEGARNKFLFPFSHCILEHFGLYLLKTRCEHCPGINLA